MNPDIISFNKVSKIYQPGGQLALSDVSFVIKEGEFACLIGPSGGGKTTILKIIAGLEAPTSGEVVKPEKVSMAFQSGALLPWLNVFDNAAFGLRTKKVSETIVNKEVGKYLSAMKMSAFSDKYPSDLSGGQRQRVGIARAFAVDPAVLLLDEPFSALDAKTTSDLHDDLIDAWRETKKTVVLVSHLIEEAVSLAERVLLVKNFKIDEEFKIDLLYPRRAQGESFMKEVLKIRGEFFK